MGLVFEEIVFLKHAINGRGRGGEEKTSFLILVSLFKDFFN